MYAVHSPAPLVLVQPEMEKRRFSVSVDSAPLGRGFSRHVGLSSDDSFWFVIVQRERIGSRAARMPCAVIH